MVNPWKNGAPISVIRLTDENKLSFSVHTANRVKKLEVKIGFYVRELAEATFPHVVAYCDIL